MWHQTRDEHLHEYLDYFNKRKNTKSQENAQRTAQIRNQINKRGLGRLNNFRVLLARIVHIQQEMRLLESLHSSHLVPRKFSHRIIELHARIVQRGHSPRIIHIITL